MSLKGAVVLEGISQLHYHLIRIFGLLGMIFILHFSCVIFSSGVKMANQLLAGVHIASAAEAMAFGARLGLNTRVLFNIITDSGGSSWYVSYTNN